MKTNTLYLLCLDCEKNSPKLLGIGKCVLDYFDGYVLSNRWNEEVDIFQKGVATHIILLTADNHVVTVVPLDVPLSVKNNNVLNFDRGQIRMEINPDIHLEIDLDSLQNFCAAKDTYILEKSKYR